MAILLVALASAFAAILSTGAASSSRKRRRTDRATRTQVQFDQTREFVTSIADAGELPSIDATNLHLESGEFVVLREVGARLAGFSSLQVATGTARKPTLAGVPLHPRAWRLECQ
jgi:hypothetical protein